MNPRAVAAVGAISFALAIVFGAFGAHALRDQISESALETFKTGQLYHALASLGLLTAGALGQVFNRKVSVHAWLMIFGILIFSGSLYLLAVTGIRWLGAITPIGGVLLITAWVMMGVSLTKADQSPVS